MEREIERKGERKTKGEAEREAVGGKMREQESEGRKEKEREMEGESMKNGVSFSFLECSSELLKVAAGQAAFSHRATVLRAARSLRAALCVS